MLWGYMGLQPSGRAYLEDDLEISGKGKPDGQPGRYA
jgi:hypothetical protein